MLLFDHTVERWNRFLCDMVNVNNVDLFVPYVITFVWPLSEVCNGFWHILLSAFSFYSFPCFRIATLQFLILALVLLRTGMQLHK